MLRADFLSGSGGGPKRGGRPREWMLPGCVREAVGRLCRLGHCHLVEVVAVQGRGVALGWGGGLEQGSPRRMHGPQR